MNVAQIKDIQSEKSNRVVYCSLRKILLDDDENNEDANDRPKIDVMRAIRIFYHQIKRDVVDKRIYLTNCLLTIALPHYVCRHDASFKFVAFYCTFFFFVFYLPHSTFSPFISIWINQDFFLHSIDCINKFFD